MDPSTSNPQPAKPAASPKTAIFGVGVAMFTALIALAIALMGQGAPGIVTGPMVQMVTPEGFSLIWRVRPSKAAEVSVATADGEREGTIGVAAEQDRWVATITGLRPGTRYRYSIQHSDRKSGEPLARGSVTTAPPGGGHSAFRVLAFGDSGCGEAAQYELAKVMGAQSPQLIVHTGDLVYPEGERRDYAKKFFEPYAGLLSVTPFYPSVGNHDYQTEQAAPMFEEFVLPRNGPAGATPERHYWFDWGDARFVAIDTDEGLNELRDQVAPWLDGVLARAESRWKICFFHHPPVTNGKTYEPTHRVIQTLVPLFDKHRVSLVLNGHNHMYERSYPLLAATQRVSDGAGTVYITTGAGGDELYEERPTPSPLLAIHDATQHSFTIFDVTLTQIRGQQINAKGKAIDEFVIPRPSPAGDFPGDNRQAVPEQLPSRSREERLQQIMEKLNSSTRPAAPEGGESQRDRRP